MLDVVELAVKELKKDFPKADIVALDDGVGGAKVLINNVELGAPFTSEMTWFSFEIPFNYPSADIYPHFTAPDLKLTDGRSFAGFAGLTMGKNHNGDDALQISRRIGKSAHETNAVAKLLGVRQWLLSI